MISTTKAITAPILIGGLALLTSCAKPKIINYNPSDFINPNREVIKTIKAKLPQPSVHATYGLGNDPAIEKAYHTFTKRGIANNIKANGFVTFAYSPDNRPIIACAPLHLCVVQLEHGEQINNIELGDSAHWMVSTALIGSQSNGSYQIAIKPKLFDTATDMVITTNRRTYNIGLVSQKGQTTHVASFYYPEETLQAANRQFHHIHNNMLKQATVYQNTKMNLSNLNFDYVLRGSQTAWAPMRVFDDGDKTFIQMPPISERMDLPVLYILKNKKMALVNYRYKRPYYIVDGLFAKAYLISGKGENQQRIEIDNQKLA